MRGVDFFGWGVRGGKEGEGQFGDVREGGVRKKSIRLLQVEHHGSFHLPNHNKLYKPEIVSTSNHYHFVQSTCARTPV